MFYGLEQLDCFQMPTLRFQHWVFLHRTFHELWHLYIYDCCNSVRFCVYVCPDCAYNFTNFSEYGYVTVYIFCLCSCVMKNACLSGIERFIVIRCPPFLSYSTRAAVHIKKLDERNFTHPPPRFESFM